MSAAIDESAYAGVSECSSNSRRALNGGIVVVNKEKEFNHAFKTNKNRGEHRNGRLSPYKNHSVHGKGAPDEYLNKKDR